MVFDPECFMDYEMIDDNELNNGLTPSRVEKNIKNVNKRGRFDGQRDLNDSSSSFEGDPNVELLKEREKNRDLQFIIGKMQNKLDNLSTEVKKLTDVILDLQNEKKQLFEMLQKKSPKKNEKKHIRNSKSKTTLSITQVPKQNEANRTPLNGNENAIERDENTSQNGNAQPQNKHTSAHSSQTYESNEIEMETNESHTVKQHDGTTDNDTDEEDDEQMNNTNNNDENAQNKKRSLKVPPVDVWTENRAEIQREIQSELPNDSCLFGRVNNGKFRVFPCDAATRLDLINLLKQKEYKYNTYTPSDEKMINVLIKGLDHIDDEDTIKRELSAKGFEPAKIQKHVTGYMRKNNIKSNLWLIVLQPNTDTNELFKIRAIDRAIVKFEFLRKPKVIQCKRCQRFNHSASNCSLPYRCVKCTDNHEPGKCTSQTKKNKFKPKCVNCQGDHTANDAANCPAFKKVIELRESKKKDSSNSNVSSQASKQTSKKTKQSYADQLKINLQQKKTNKRENIDHFINNQNKILSEFMTTIQKMQQQFISTFASKNGQ